MFRVSSTVRKKQREIVGDSLVNPLVAIAGPADDVAPPLMRNFVIRNKLREMLLAAGAETSPLLRFRRKKRKRGNVQEPRPTLAEGSGNLRNAQIVKGKGAGEGLVEMDRRINLLSELLQGIGGTGRGPRKCECESRGRNPDGLGGNSNSFCG